MKLKRLIEELAELNLPDAEVVLSLPGNRFSPLTLVEKVGKAEEKPDGEAKVVTHVVCLYPHPRDLSVATAAGVGAAPGEERHPIVAGIDALLDFMGGSDGEEKGK